MESSKICKTVHSELVVLREEASHHSEAFESAARTMATATVKAEMLKLQAKREDTARGLEDLRRRLLEKAISVPGQHGYLTHACSSH